MTDKFSQWVDSKGLRLHVFATGDISGSIMLVPYSGDSMLSTSIHITADAACELADALMECADWIRGIPTRQAAHETAKAILDCVTDARKYARTEPGEMDARAVESENRHRSNPTPF